jgi:SAM-dependent methyltransferase
VLEKLGRTDFTGLDVLDVGCGSRFTQAILNLDLPIGSYTGVDVDRALIDFLKDAVHDPRFSFAHFDVHNAKYNPEGTARMTAETELPVTGTYDVIWLFSVLTHLVLEDADAMLAVLRRYVRPDGRLFFTVFIEEDAAGFEYRDRSRALERAAYTETYLRELLIQNGWDVLGIYPRDLSRFVQHHCLCRPGI